jgi:hypothetical protein
MRTRPWREIRRGSPDPESAATAIPAERCAACGVLFVVGDRAETYPDGSLRHEACRLTPRPQ